MRRSQGGQATVEWSALLLVTAVLLAGLGYAVAQTQAWGTGEGILHSIVCAVRGDCDDDPRALERAYGAEVAGLVRRYSPNVAYERSSAALPIDFRRCREQECANGPNDPVEIERSSAGLPVTAFTRVVDRREAGGALYIQYWFYDPESLTAGIGRMFGDRWPGYHADDWEGVQLMLRPDRPVLARATSHGGYSSGWQRWSGWYWVAGGSHAGRVVAARGRDRTTPSSMLSLAPLEPMRDRRHTFAVTPPWLKEVYRDPEAASS